MNGKEGPGLRKALRLTALVFPCLYAFASQVATVIFVASLLVVLAGLEVARLRHPAVNERLFGCAGAVLREGERSRVTAITWFVLASLLLGARPGNGVEMRCYET
ncbi:MAG: hypothetical protein QN120_15120 [Armatimonadota bacterium]|nr:hypothetical protein [Armatimonadota bacterium]